jgi:hypothetical protein
VTIALAILAAVQLLHAQRVRREQNRPYVIVDFEFRSFVIYLAIRNIGSTVARNARISFDKKLGSTLPGRAKIDDLRLFTEPIPMLAPGRRISVLLDSFPARVERGDLPMSYTVTVDYEDSSGRPYNDPPYPLDLGTYRESAMEPKGLPELVGEVEKLRKEAAKWTEGHRGLLTYVVDKQKLQSREHRPFLREQAAAARKERGWRGWASWQLDHLRRKYGWERWTD